MENGEPVCLLPPPFAHQPLGRVVSSGWEYLNGSLIAKYLLYYPESRLPHMLITHMSAHSTAQLYCRALWTHSWTVSTEVFLWDIYRLATIR